MMSNYVKTARTSRTSLSILLAGFMVATAAVTDIVLRSEMWVPLYAGSLMPASQWDFEADTISTAPVYAVRDNYLVLPGRARPIADDVVVSAANDPCVE